MDKKIIVISSHDLDEMKVSGWILRYLPKTIHETYWIIIETSSSLLMGDILAVARDKPAADMIKEALELLDK